MLPNYTCLRTLALGLIPHLTNTPDIKEKNSK